MKYQAYEEYKGSGVEWLGCIPVSWHTLPIKRISEIFNGATPKSGEKAYWDGDVSWITPADLGKTTSPFISSGARSITTEGFDSCGTSLVPVGTILLSSRAPIGSLGIATNDLCTNQGCKSLVVDKRFYSKYLYYVLLSSTEQLNLLGRGTTFLELSSNELGAYKIGFPPKEEQQRIANFLDHETAKIDTLIEKQQQLIKLLKEKRQAVISHAVTKGLNPTNSSGTNLNSGCIAGPQGEGMDSPSSPPMRDSGVEWLGEVPEHWVVNNINYVLNAIGDVDHYMPQSVEKGIPYVMTGDLKELASSINFEDCKQVSHKDYLKLSNKIKSSRGDVIMARYATIGTASYIDVNADFLVSYSCVTIKPNLSKVIGLYLFYYFKSDAFLQGIQNQINTNTQGNVGVNDLKKVKVALPTLAEQSRIIEYLQSKISKLNSISDRSQAAIDLMQERRTALISAAVTGKIDLRNWQSPNNANKDAIA